MDGHAEDVDPTGPTCRLHVYLARDAPLGVVLRRGPAAWARLSLWRTDTDTFEHGQWIRGRVYARRCDLSSDGSLFVAFIRTNAARRRPDQKADTWVAVSRPPYFTALALWWVGGTYCAGGLFAEARSLWLGWKDGPDQGVLPAWLERASTVAHVDRTNNWTDRMVFHNRLLRDGWKLVVDAGRETWEHRHPRQPLDLLFRELGWDARAFGGPHQVEYLLRDADGEEVSLPGVTWADLDQRGRLIMVRRGKLLHRRSRDEYVELADFNAQVPESAAAPGWAQRWPRRPG
jgi:hypothetical protein